LRKIYTSIAAQQGQQWYIAWLTRIHQLIDQLYQGQSVQHVKDITLGMTSSAQKAWQEVQFQFYNGQWNTLEFYRQLPQLYGNKDISKRILFIFIYLISFKIIYIKSLFVLFSASRREIVFCVTGITIGAVIGYYIGASWRFNSYHTHHIKAVACYHYYGIEVCHI